MLPQSKNFDLLGTFESLTRIFDICLVFVVPSQHFGRILQKCCEGTKNTKVFGMWDSNAPIVYKTMAFQVCVVPSHVFLVFVWYVWYPHRILEGFSKNAVRVPKIQKFLEYGIQMLPQCTTLWFLKYFWYPHTYFWYLFGIFDAITAFWKVFAKMP